jgi:uncharacterized membrane protein YhdT
MSSKEIKFFENLYTQYLKNSKVPHRIAIAFWCILVGVACAIPAQETIREQLNGETILGVLPASIVAGSAFAVSACIAPFRTYTEQNIKNNVGSVIQLLQYHPIDKVKIQKQKLKYRLNFLIKFSLLMLVVQLVFSYGSLKTIGWINFVYIFGTVFMAPAILETLMSWIKIKFLYGE